MDNNIDNKQITISFTEELLEEWIKIYFKQHPRSKKKPIEYASHPSINKWSILMRITCNQLKQNWKDFGQFVARKHGYEDLGISKCKCKVIIYKASLGRVDPDNFTPKMVFDSLTAETSGVIIDDGDNCITSLTIEVEYRKGKHEMDIIFYDIEGYDKELLFETRLKEQNKKAKREETTLKNKAKKTKKKSTTKKSK